MHPSYKTVDRQVVSLANIAPMNQYQTLSCLLIMYISQTVNLIYKSYEN